MKNSRLNLCIISLLTGLFYITCSKSETKPEKRNWPEFISQIETVVAEKKPDSVKFQHLSKIFEEKNLSAREYQEFRNYYINKHPEKSIPVLEQVEKILTEEIRKAAEEQRKRFKKRNQELRR
jgi:hypothetical protein